MRRPITAEESRALRFTGTRTIHGCAVRIGGRRVTLSGTSGLAVRSEFEVTTGRPRTQTTTYEGSLEWERSGEEGTCEVDMRSVYDYHAQRITLTGSFCGAPVSESRTWVRNLFR